MIKIKRSEIIVVVERIEFTGPSLEVIDQAHEIAPKSDGWRFVSQSLGENGLTEIRERTVLSKVANSSEKSEV